MGGAQSSNVASAVQNVVNYVDNSTVANSSQVSNVAQKTSFSRCFVKSDGDFYVKSAANLAVKNSQIAKALQNADIQNDLQQTVLQEAISKVGSLGIGYASASNSASMLVNSSNTIKNAMSTVSNQFSSTSQTFDCKDSVIIAKNNIDIDFSNTADFLSSQVLDNSQVATVVNNISQTLTQKASATVEGLAGFLLALAFVIIAVGYSLAKPLTTGGGKIIIVVILLVVILLILSFMFIRKTPPFFNENNDCSPYSDIGGCNGDCINVQQGVKKIDNCPLRYIYGLNSGSISLSGANLIEIAISFKFPNINGGYNMQRCNDLKQVISGIYNELKNHNIIIEDKIPDLLVPVATNEKYSIPLEYLKAGNDKYRTAYCTPSTLKFASATTDQETRWQTTCPSEGNLTVKAEDSAVDDTIMANINKEAWNTYLNNDNSFSKRAKIARYILCDILQVIPLNIYIEDDEIVKYKDENGNTKINYAKDATKYCYKFNPYVTYDFIPGLLHGGTLTGQYGVCNDNTYKYHTFMKNIGGWIMLVLLLVFFGFLFFQWKNNKKIAKDK